MKLTADAIRALGAIATGGAVEQVEFDTVSDDSRNVRPGSVFVAVRGTRQDGHAFLRDACRAGAALIVVEDEPSDCGTAWIRVSDSRAALSRLAALVHADPTRSLTLVGVTGTDGKTSTAILIEAGMTACGLRAGLIGTVVYRMPGFEEPAAMTTPDPIRLQGLFARMVASGVRGVAMEVSSHALDQRRVDGCAFAAAVFTNLTRDHLDYHKSHEAYAGAKLRLFEEVLPASPHARGAVVNADDPFSETIQRRCPLPVVGFSLRGEPAPIHPVGSRYTLDGTEALLRTPWGEFPVRTRLIGAHNLANWMAAFGVAGTLGLPLDEFRRGLDAVERIPGRLERVRGRKDVQVFVDYAHTPKAIENLLNVVRPLARGARITIVFGAGGDRDRGKRPLMGQAAAKLADRVIVTSDNPRTEDPLAIIADIEQGVRSALEQGAAASVVVEPDRRRAIERAIREAGPSDVVLIAGKGHEAYQIIGTTRHEFSDVAVAREMLDRC